MAKNTVPRNVRCRRPPGAGLAPVGERAGASRRNEQENRDSSIYGPFVAGLKEAVATEFIDESAQRQLMMDAQNRVLLEKQDPAESLKVAAGVEQKILDGFYKG